LNSVISKLLGRIFSKRDPATLYISIDELPNPRDWGTLDFAVGGKLIFSEDVNLLAGSADAVLDLMALHWQTIQSSGYQRIAYHNVSSWLQERIEQKLYRGWTADRTLSLQIPVGGGIGA
jgi:hypothetical protein